MLYLGPHSTVTVDAFGSCAIHKNLTKNTDVATGIGAEPEFQPRFQSRTDQNGRKIDRTYPCHPAETTPPAR